MLWKIRISSENKHPLELSLLMISMFLLRVFCPLLFENHEKEFCLFFFYQILAQSNLQIFLHWKTPPQRREGGQLCGFFCPMASIRSARCYILQIFRPKERWIEPIILHKMATNKKSGKARPTTMWIHVLIFTVGCIMFCKGRGCNISFESTHTGSRHAIGENECWLLIFGAVDWFLYWWWRMIDCW